MYFIWVKAWKHEIEWPQKTIKKKSAAKSRTFSLEPHTDLEELE